MFYFFNRDTCEKPPPDVRGLDLDLSPTAGSPSGALAPPVFAVSLGASGSSNRPPTGSVLLLSRRVSPLQSCSHTGLPPVWFVLP